MIKVDNVPMNMRASSFHVHNLRNLPRATATERQYGDQAEHRQGRFCGKNIRWYRLAYSLMEMVARWPLEQHEKLFLPKNVCEIINIHPKVCLNCLSQRRYYAGGLLCWNMKRCYSIGGWCGLRRFADEAECAMKRPLVTL